MPRSQVGKLSWSSIAYGGIHLENVHVWPELKPRTLCIRSSNSAAENVDHGESSASTNANDTVCIDLGDVIAKNKNSNASVKLYKDKDFQPQRVSVESKPLRPERKCKSGEKIRINLQDALNSTRSVKRMDSKQCGRIKINVYKRKPVASPTDKNKCREIQKTRICFPRNTKLRKVIVLQREIKAEMNAKKRLAFEIAKMEAISKDVNAINFSALKITADSERDYVKRMSTLSFYDKNYRNPSESNIPEDSFHPTPEISDKFNNLRVGVGNIRIPLSKNKFLSCNKHEDYDITDYDTFTTVLSLKTTEDTKDDIKQGLPDNKSSLRYSRNFREYCTNILTPGLNENLETLLREILRLQRKQYERNENKAKYKRRYYSGLKEVRKHVEMKKVKFIIIAPDIEKIVLEGGLDDEVFSLIETCKKNNVVFCFGLRRRKLGYYTHGKGFAGCIGIANYNGAEEIFKNVLTELVHARNAFNKLINEEKNIIDLSELNVQDYLLSESVTALLKILSPNNL